MNDSNDSPPQSDQGIDVVDLVSDLKTNLAAEFENALSSATELTGGEKECLAVLVRSGRASAEDILNVLETLEQKDK